MRRQRFVRVFACAAFLLPCASLASAPDCSSLITGKERLQLTSRVAACTGAPAILSQEEAGNERYGFGGQTCLGGHSTCNKI